MRTRKRRAFLWVGLAILLACAPGCASPGSDAGFFRGRTVAIIVPYGKGGMDDYARSIAPFLEKYLPGSRVEVHNVTGGGGIEGKNLIFTAPPDGLTLGFTPGSGLLLAEWRGDPGVKYRTAAFSWIGGIKAEAHVMVASPGSGFRNIGNVVTAGRLRMGFPGSGSDDYPIALIAAKLLGYEVEALTSFSSPNDATLACVRGDVDAVQLSRSSVISQIEAGTLVPLVTFGEAREADLPDVPTIFEVVPTDRHELVRSLVRIYELQRTLIAPPGVPARRLAALRGALDKSMADQELRQNLARLKRPADYLTGVETAKLLESIRTSEDGIKPLLLDVMAGSR